MDKDKQHSVWVDLENRVISFRQHIGFKEFRFPTREDMLAFAVEVSENGFSIQ